ncbi:ethanolamine ammonia-lyase subunit EutC [Hymenobacter negativus]|uniref:Ethanolamine ammonia-lyase small subunit n=1 Tax=Hymenobacter negativus TaxID=2795026 RepID=A0ABS3QPE0_9BACT|nr:ethanolamine ammonia-lyase subunit EutC [Hymenobacter negativus]MBO2013155.1 ethanolamine ammonia-lyase subunit EutC [Hymenobacter negativus]
MTDALLSFETPEPDPWASLKSFTAARIALGRSGSSVPLREALAFRLAHAHARDAVYSSLDVEALVSGLEALGQPGCQVKSQAENRQQYLQRPDKGRMLSDASRNELMELRAEECDVAVVLADGLSATAVNLHALPLLQSLLPRLREAGLRLGLVVLAEQARVALGDEIGELLQARLVLMLIGERPGLSAPDSLGAYLTYAPRPGMTDETRNCVSSIRPQGLTYSAASTRLVYLIGEALRRQLSGVALKDQSEQNAAIGGS